MNSRKIRLLHTVLNLGTAGLERIVTELSLKLDKSRFDVEVCCFKDFGQFADLLRANGVTVTKMPVSTSHADPLFHPWRLSRYLRRQRIDIIHTHTGTFFNGAFAGWLARTPAVVYTEHGRFPKDPLIRIIEDRIAIRFADKVTVVSEEQRQRLINSLKFSVEKIELLINSVNTETFLPRPKPPALLREFSVSESQQVIVHVASQLPVKDQITLIRAFQLVHKRLPETLLLLVGDGPERAKLESLTSELGLQGKVIFAGIRKDISELLNLADLFVLSSLMEGTPVSLLEAMASGVPPVVTRVGGNPVVVQDDINGLIVEPKDAEGMADAMIRILTDQSLHTRFRENAVKRVRDAYSLDQMVRRFTEIYVDLLRRRGQDV